MKKKIGGFLLVGAGLAAALWAWDRNGHEPVAYRFTEVERGDIRAVVSTTGTLEAVTTVSVGTQVSGMLAEIKVDFNDKVRAGQVVARLDTTLLETAVRDAEAQLARTEAERLRAERDHARMSSLFDEELVSQSELDATENVLAVARASAESAAVGVVRARQNLAYATITSPISGTVIQRTVDVGQTVAASLAAPELFLIAADLTKMQILAAVDESDIGLIREGQAAQFTVQAYPDETFAGTVRQVRLQSSTQENVVNYTVVIDVDNPELRLLPGMTATVEFVVASAEDVLKIANAALRFRPTQEMAAELRERREQQRADGAPMARPGGGEGRAGSGGGEDRPEAGGADRSSVTPLWYLDDGGQLTVVPVRTGLSDGQMTQIDGRRLAEGMQVIIGASQGGGASTAAAAASPFTSGQQQPRAPGPPPMPGF
jgi:HlyD family secretion protein